MRYCHFIKPNHASQTIQNAIFVDTETNFKTDDHFTGTHHLRFGFAAFTRRIKGLKWSKPQWCRFESISEFWSFVYSHLVQKKRLYIFCHNTNFDLPVLDTFNQLEQMGIKTDMIVIEGPPTIIKGSIDGKNLVILDTLNFWRMPLKKVGELIGIDKLVMPTDINDQQLNDIYCKRDVEIIMRAVQIWADFLVSHDYGGFAYTLAGQAMRLYRHRFMPYDIGIHDNEEAINLERKAYMGGRNEATRIGKLKGKWILVDVNSMYPYVMQKYNYPTLLRYWSNRKDIDDLRDIIKDNLVIAEVELNTDHNAYAVRHLNKLVYPIGIFTTTLCTPELLYALENNHIQRVKQLAAYRYAPIFRDYVTELYAYRVKLKEAGDKLNDNQYKLLLNSLYGKFGQRGLVYEITDKQVDPSKPMGIEVDVDTGKVVKYRSLCGVVQVLSEESESRDSFPGIAAHVTAYARMHLWRLINEVGQENVAYYDTDSLLFKDTAYDRISHLLDSTSLGLLKIEGTFDDVEIWGCKDYRFNDRTKTKGIKKSSIHVGQKIYIQQKWSSLKGQLRNRETNAPRTSTIYKRLRRVYDKGVVLSDGTVSPLVFFSDILPLE